MMTRSEAFPATAPHDASRAHSSVGPAVIRTPVPAPIPTPGPLASVGWEAALQELAVLARVAAELRCPVSASDGAGLSGTDRPGEPGESGVDADLALLRHIAARVAVLADLMERGSRPIAAAPPSPPSRGRGRRRGSG